jgi:hypothetical protein
MEKRIQIFKSFEEQERYYTDKMLNSTPVERLSNLLRMQKVNLLLHPPVNNTRRIIIKKNGYSK